MKYLLFFLLTGCIPTGQLVRTDNPRSGVWVTETGHQVIWRVDQPEIVAANCNGWHGCVRWIPGERRMQLWTVDSATMAAHECAHALGFSRAMTAADIQAEINHWPWQLFSGGPALAEPCEASTWSNGDKPGRLKTVEQFEHERGKP